jgi:hypothetical protein
MEDLQSSQIWNIDGGMITTVEELVEAFGGVKGFSAVVGRSLPPVYRAKDRNHIPYKWRPSLYQEVKRRNLPVSPDLLGFEAA